MEQIDAINIEIEKHSISKKQHKENVKKLNKLKLIQADENNDIRIEHVEYDK